MTWQPPTGPFTCDACRVEHKFARDYGKTVPIEEHLDGSECTGWLCRACAYGEGNRAERRAAGKEARCLTACRSR